MILPIIDPSCACPPISQCLYLTLQSSTLARDEELETEIPLIILFTARPSWATDTRRTRDKLLTLSGDIMEQGESFVL